MQGVTRRKGGQVGFADPCARMNLISPRRRRDGCAQVTAARRLSRGCGAATYAAGRRWIRGADGRGLPRATAQLSIRPEPQAGRKDGQLAVTQSRSVSMSQNTSDPSVCNGSAVPKVHLYW